ncbi:hypothetical protein EYR40_008631 [Pleurotus pulmonarius]|nr:hypothetical protein EYR36_009451 [Pleurotus pulmonarius]KAF4593837.1 hypothetical protein EYR40_008631 [Pleurotus pulmonarius]
MGDVSVPGSIKNCGDESLDVWSDVRLLRGASYRRSHSCLFVGGCGAEFVLEDRPQAPAKPLTSSLFSALNNQQVSLKHLPKPNSAFTMKSFFVAICAAATLVAANCEAMRFQKPDAAYFTSLEKSVPALDLCFRMCAPSIPTCPEHWYSNNMGTADKPCWTCCQAPKYN